MCIKLLHHHLVKKLSFLHWMAFAPSSKVSCAYFCGSISGFFACILCHFSHVQLCVTLWTAAHQAPLSTGFSRQEHWLAVGCHAVLQGSFQPRDWTRVSYIHLHCQAGSLPLVPPGNPHPSYWFECLSSNTIFSITIIVSDSLWPHRLCLPGSSVHGILQATLLEWVAISFYRGSSLPRDGT